MNKRQALLDYASSLTQLKDIGGGKQAGCCPIHEEKTASFHIYANGDQATCFGCGFQGDVFDLWMALNGGDFIDAKRHFGFSSNSKPRYNKKKEFPKEVKFSEEKRKEIYILCKDSLIEGVDIQIIMLDRKLWNHEFIYLCLKDNPDWKKYFNFIHKEIKSWITKDMFKNYFDERMDEL